MSNAKENKLKMKDIAMIGIFGALLFVIKMLAGSLMALSMTVQMYSVSIIAILSAPLYMLVMAKVHKHCYPYMSIGQAVMTSSISFVLPVGVAILSRGAVTLNEVILCLLSSMGLAGSLQAMIEFWQDIFAIYEIQPRIQSLLDAEELPVPTEPRHPNGAEIVLRDIHFSYGDAEVIHGASFTAKEGTVTALVGPSGSGKSTLAKLIARFWDVNAGRYRSVA